MENWQGINDMSFTDRGVTSSRSSSQLHGNTTCGLQLH